MDERQSDHGSRGRGAQSAVSRAPARTRERMDGQAPTLPDVATPAEESMLAATRTDTTSGILATLDPRDPRVQARLRKRTATGGYEVADTELVRAIRVWDAQGMRHIAMQLAEPLIDRCMPQFRRSAAGLRHRPELMEEAIEGMVEQVLTEALNPTEVFMTQNFIHYLRCVCADNFTRMLRQEGLRYRRDEQGRPAGRPNHIPRALIDQIATQADEQDDQPSGVGVVADPRDALDERMASVEALRILERLPDALDRRIFALRALYKMQWEEIATLCGKTERTMRLRFEKARVTLQNSLAAEAASDNGGE